MCTTPKVTQYIVIYSYKATETYHKVVPPKRYVYCFINPMNTIDISPTKNHSEIGVMCTNLAIIWGHRLAEIADRGYHLVI